MIVRACLRSAATTMTVPLSSPSSGRQSLKQAAHTATRAQRNDFPERRPQINHASVSGCAGGVLRPVCLR
jgi:hypothetical protein